MTWAGGGETFLYFKRKPLVLWAREKLNLSGVFFFYSLPHLFHKTLHILICPEIMYHNELQLPIFFPFSNGAVSLEEKQNKKNKQFLVSSEGWLVEKKYKSGGSF